MKKVLFTATVDSHILCFHIPYLKYFKEKGFEVHVATNGEENIPYCDKKIKIPFERSPYKINNLIAIKQLKKVLKQEHYEIIHTHTPMGAVVTRLASKTARKSGTRLIYTAHGFHFFKGAPFLYWCLFYPVEKYLSRYTDTLVLINKEDYQLARKKFKKCRRIEYIPGIGINEERFDFCLSKEEKRTFREELGLKESDYVLIYPAELNKNKNQVLLIKSMEKLVKKYPNIHLLLPGKDSYNGYYHSLVEKKKLNKNIHFLGFRNDIAKLTHISNLAVASSKREGLPVNILESMYVGLPIVALDSRGTRDLIEDNQNGFIIKENNSDMFYSKIEYLYQNPSVAKKMGKLSKQKVKPYLLNTILSEMKKIYED